MYEIEAKIRIKSDREWQNLLAKVKQKAVFQKECFKKDIYFGKEDSEKVFFRLRTTDYQKHEITVKTKKIKNGIEKNEEDSFKIDNTEAFFVFAEKINLKKILTKQKKSLIYQKKEVYIELNKIKNLGNFLEIEILCQHENETQKACTKLISVFQELGYTEKDFEPLPYLQLIQTRN